MPGGENGRVTLTVLAQRFEDFRTEIREETVIIRQILEKMNNPKDGLYINIHDNKKALDALGKKVDEHDCYIHGYGEKKGFAERVSNLENFRDIIKSYFLKIVTPILSALGIGLIIVIYLALTRLHHMTQMLDKLNP